MTWSMVNGQWSVYVYVQIRIAISILDILKFSICKHKYTGCELLSLHNMNTQMVLLRPIKNILDLGDFVM